MPGGVVRQIAVADLREAITHLQEAVGTIGEAIAASGDGEQVTIGHTEIATREGDGGIIWYPIGMCLIGAERGEMGAHLEDLVRFLQLLCENFKDLQHA